MHLGPERRRRVARHHAGPVRPITARTNRRLATEQLQDVPIAIGVDDRQQRHLHLPQRGLELREVRRGRHLPVLLEDSRRVEPDHPEGNVGAVDLSDHGPVHARTDEQLLLAQRAVRVLHLERLLPTTELEHLTIEAIPAALNDVQAVEVSAVVGIDGVRPAQVVVERDDEEGQADQSGPVDVDLRRSQLGLVPEVLGGPGVVRVGQQQRPAARGALRPHRPAIGAFLRMLHDAIQFAAAREPCEVKRALLVSQEIGAAHRQDRGDVAGDLVGVLGGVGVDTARECIQPRADAGALLAVPRRGALGYAHRVNPAIILEVRLSPVLRRASAGLAQEPEQQIAMTLRLRPAVREEETLGIGGKDMRHAPAVPEDLGCGKRLDPSSGLGASGAQLRHRVLLLAAGYAESEEEQGESNKTPQDHDAIH